MNTLEIIRAISTIVANTHDGASRSDGERIKIGLRREEGCPIYDSRVMDGFKVKFEGPNLGIVYQSEIPVKEMHEVGFENKINDIINDIVVFLKKEYKQFTGKNLQLKPEKEGCEINARYLNGFRSWVECYKRFKIGNIKDVEDYREVPEKAVIKENIFRKFRKLNKS